jgi:hypothetical protein
VLNEGIIMFRHLIALAVVGSQTIVTSPVELIDNSPKTPGIVIVNAKTSPQVKKNTVVFPCIWAGAPWRYSVSVPCPTPAAPIVTAIAAARITTACKDVGANAQWTYASKGGTYGNACITRAMDAVPLDGALNEPRVFQDITLASSRHFITQKGTAWKAFSNVTLQRFDVTAWKRGIFIRGGSRDWLIQDFRIKGSRINTSPGDIPVGIAMGGATNIVIRRGEISGFQTVLADEKKYANADCISAERGDSFTATDIYAHDCTDGIIDTKATTHLDRVRAANAGHYSYRFWALVTAGTLISENPGSAHIQIAAASTDVTIDKLIAVGPRAIIAVDSKGIGGKITIKGCDLSKWTGTSLLSGFYTRAKIELGKGCTLPR